MGYNYLFAWAFTLPLELTVCGIVVGYWDTSTSIGVWITVMWILIILINVFGSLGYAEEEFWAAILKIITISIFMVIGLVMILGGGPSSGKYNKYSGTKLWSDPGAFRHGFRASVPSSSQPPSLSTDRNLSDWRQRGARILSRHFRAPLNRSFGASRCSTSLASRWSGSSFGATNLT